MDAGNSVPDPANEADRLIEAYLPYAYKAASRFLGRGLPFDDLRQAAALGLTNAARRFDPSFGVDFAVFAFKFIEGEIRFAVRKNLPLRQDPGPSDRPKGAAASGSVVVPIDSVYREGRGSDAFELRDPNSDFETDSAEQLYLKSLLGELSSDERKLIVLRFFHCLTQEQTGRLMGLSQSQVSRNEKAILHKLRINHKAEGTE